METKTTGGPAEGSANGAPGRERRYPFLGRAFLWVDRPGNPLKIVWGLAAACAGLVVLDVLLVEHKSGGMESIPGFYAVAGFVMFSTIIIAARILRTIIGRGENYYSGRAVDDEDYPPDQLGIRDRDV